MIADACRHPTLANVEKWLPEHGHERKLPSYRSQRFREIAVLEKLYLGDALRPKRRGWRVISSSSTLAQTFDELANRWTRETAHFSSTSQIAMHPSYQQIMALGRSAVPLVLRRLAAKPDHWFWALRFMTSEDPVNPEDAGDFDKMREAWLRWGASRGIL